MYPLRVIIVLLLLNLISAAEVVIPDGLEYTPPEFLSEGYRPSGNAPSDAGAVLWAFNGKDNAGLSHYRSIDFGVYFPGKTVGKGARISYRTLTEDEIKKLFLEMARRVMPVPKVEDITLAGRKAYKMDFMRTHEELPVHYEFIWVPVHPNVIYTVGLMGSSEELLKTVRDSLSKVKILPGAAIAPWEREPELHVAKDAIRLGMLPSDAAEASGKPVLSRAFESYFYDGTYIIVMVYEIRVMRSVIYMKAKEPGKYLKPIRNFDAPEAALLQPLTAEEVDVLLARHGSDPKGGTKLTWTKSTAKENRWDRSDGVAAEYDPKEKMLRIATKEAWEGKRSKQPGE